MRKLQLSFFIVCACLLSYGGFSQPASDLAISHNRLIREKTADDLYKLIGTFKVVGTPYLYGEKNKGHLFSPEATAFNIFLSYNTYSQELEFCSTSNPDKPLVKEPGEVDSFVILPNIELGILTPLKFVHGKHIGSKENAYYEEIYSGDKYSIYKKYKSELGYVSTNYIQSELRQFDLGLDYYYNSPDKQMKKLKANSSTVIKEFKNVKDLSLVINEEIFTINAEEAFRKTFEYLNK